MSAANTGERALEIGPTLTLVIPISFFFQMRYRNDESKYGEKKKEIFCGRWCNS